MVFGIFGKKKASLKIEPRQELEIELKEGEEPQSYICHCINMEKKKIVLSMPARGEKQAPCALGDQVTLAFLNDAIYTSCDTRIIEKRSNQIEVAVPREVFEEKTSFATGELVPRTCRWLRPRR